MQHDGALRAERDARDDRGDVRVAVAIAADPACPSAGTSAAATSPPNCALEPILERAVHARRDLEQRAAKHVERGLDLVERRRPVRARILGRMEREHLGFECVRSRATRVVEQSPDPRQVIECRPPARLRRVRGDHGHDERAAIEQRAKI